MNDFLTEDTKAIILLCGIFGKERSEKPLTQTEYTKLVGWLISVEMRPSDLLQKESITAASMGTGIDKQRLEALLNRGVQLGFAVEEWQRNGIWVISRSDTDYPIRYKKHLKDKAPPLLFGAGKRSLLNGGGLGIVGSRNVDQEGEDFTRQVAEMCAYNQMPVVSGGARGVDQISMRAALGAGGVTIGILAENLLKKSVERTARHAIADGCLLLLSPYHPNARFTVGTAMGRNKLIYAMADYGLIVSADYNKGGTWAGATEELKRENARPVFVRVGNNAPQGNTKLLEWGAIAWPDSINTRNFKQQLCDLETQNKENQSAKNQCLFDFENTQTGQTKAEAEKVTATEAEITPSKPKQTIGSIYEAVLPVILDSLESPTTPKELAKSLNVNKTQLNEWLKKALEENKIIKLSKPVRYQKAESGTQV